MPTYLLDGNTEARIASGPVRIEVHASNGTAFALVATVDGAPAVTISPRSDILVLPRLSSKTLVAVTAPNRAVFAQGTVLNVTIAIDGPPSADPERIVLSDVEVSGLTGQELLSLELREGSITASSFVSKPDDSPLAGLAKAAQVATREVLGTDRIDGTSAINIVTVVDASASMLSRTRDGSVRAVLDMLSGMSRVVSPGLNIVAALVDDGVTWIDGEQGSLGERVDAALDARTLGTSFRSASPALAARFPNQNTVTYVISDAVPADIAELEAADDVEGEARHLVVVGDLLALDVQGRPSIPLTVVDAGDPGRALSARLEGDGSELRRVVKSLLNGCFVPGTSYAKKVL